MKWQKVAKTLKKQLIFLYEENFTVTLLGEKFLKQEGR
jgi:hypothetical protein